MTPSSAREDESLPPVTVAIPAFNAEAFLADAVESARRQDYRGPISIVVLDDGSTDRTVEVAERLAQGTDDLRIHSQSNRGRAAARNRLVELVETELLAWLDADDIAAPNWISEQAAYLRANPRCVAVTGQAYAMTGDALPIGPIPPRPADNASIERLHLEGESAFYQSCVLVRKSAVEKAGGYDPALNYGEDCDLWLRMAEAGELASVPSCHLYYRKHPSAGTVIADFAQRERSLKIVDEARARRGLPPLERRASESPSPKKDDWNSRIHWIVLALRSGNPYTALKMAGPAIRKHPASPAMWLAATVALLDAILFLGNRTSRLTPGMPARFGELPRLSFFRLARRSNELRRKLFRKTS